MSNFDPIKPLRDLANELQEKAAQSARKLLSPVGWQPIETAPKHWKILAYEPPTIENGIEIVSGDFYTAWREGDDWIYAVGETIDDYKICEPTHWMPLPEPPK